MAGKTIAFFIDWISSPYHIELVTGLELAARRRGVNLITVVGGCLDSPKDYERNSNFLYDYVDKELVDGIIIESEIVGQYISPEAMLKFRGRYEGIPFISLSGKIEGCPSISVENSEGLRNLVLHLVEEHGCKKIAFISGPPENHDAIERLNTYKAVLQEKGIPFDEALVLPGVFINKSGEEAVKTLLDARGIMPDAIVAANDDMAMGALKELLARGIKVPDEVKVTGFDDQKDSPYMEPPLSTVRRPLFGIAQQAIDSLLEEIRGTGTGADIVLPTETVIRGSCGCPYASSQSSVEEDEESCSLFPGDIKKIMPIVDIYRNLGYARDIGRMENYLNWAFPVIGINRCMFASFVNSKTDSGELLFTYTPEEGGHLIIPGKVMPTRELLMTRMMPEKKPFSLRLFALVYDAKVLGFTAYTVHQNRTILDSAMRSSFLLNILKSVIIHQMVLECPGRQQNASN